MEKAYKVLAKQEGISNNEAKLLIDSGLVFAKGKKVLIARALISPATKFNIKNAGRAEIIFEDENLIAVNKPYGTTSEKISEMFKAPLLHRLDKETSGVLLLVKNDEFAAIAKAEFKKLLVDKNYVAIVKGIVSDDILINEPIITIKGKNGAMSKISKDGKTAISEVYPIMVVGKKSLVKVNIKTGRTHQIRVHLASVDLPIVGDEKYGKNASERMYLHAYSISILGYNFTAPIPKDFNAFGFEILQKMKI